MKILYHIIVLLIIAVSVYSYIKTIGDLVKKVLSIKNGDRK